MGPYGAFDSARQALQDADSKQPHQRRLPEASSSGVEIKSVCPYKAPPLFFLPRVVRSRLIKNNAQVTAYGRFLRPGRALQLCEEVDGPANRFVYFSEWGLPEEANAQVVDGGALIFLSSLPATRPARIFALLVRSKESPDHIYPAAPGNSKGKLYRLISKISFPSKRYEGRRAPVLARVIARSSRVRCRGSARPNLSVCAGDPFAQISTRGQSYNQLHVRSCMPADEATWMLAKPYSQ